MLNKEKYRDKIFEIAVNHDTCGVKNGEVRSCGEISCYECDFYSSDHCDIDFHKWANSGYKESEIDWSMVPVDTPVLVCARTDTKTWFKKHFACLNNGKIMVFTNGCTSWTSNGNVTDWHTVKLAREEDIEKYRKR